MKRSGWIVRAGCRYNRLQSSDRTGATRYISASHSRSHAKNADGYIKAALQTSYADLFMPVEVSCSIKMMLDGKLRSFKTKLCLGDGSYQSISGSVTEPKLHEYLEQHIRIGSKREQILLSNEELIKDLQNNQQNQAVVKETIEFLRTELDNCERTQMKLNCSEEILANSVKRGCIMAMQKEKLESGMKTITSVVILQKMETLLFAKNMD